MQPGASARLLARCVPAPRARRVLSGFAALVAFALVAMAQPLDRAVKRALGDARLGDARVGVMILDITTGDTLADSAADDPFIPASNMKVFTSAAAVSILGPEFVFRTELAVAGDRLVVRASGDPAFADPELLRKMGVSADEFLDKWRQAVVDSGATGLREIVLDTRIFDDEPVHPTWPADQLNRWYCAEVWGLNFHANLLSVYASPLKPGMAPQVRIEPSASWLTIENLARTVTTGENTIWISRSPAGNDMKLHGNVRRASEAPIEIAVHDMPGIFGRMLADRIEQAGLGRPSVRRATADEAFPDARVIAVVRTEIPVILERCNTDSYNLYAEALLKRMGHEITGQPGSWTTGAAALRMVVQDKVGARLASSLVIADGSGMSRDNRITPHLMVSWLAAVARDERIRQPFLDSLPVAAETGTLRKRFNNNKPGNEVRAKTGYINGVSTLSGFIADGSGRQRVAFSVLVNNLPGSLPMQRVKDFQEKVAVLADDWLERQQAAAADATPGG